VTPIGAVLLVVPISLLLSLRIPDRDYRSYYLTPKTMDDHDALLFSGAAAFLILGIAVPMALSRRRWRPGWPGLATAELDLIGKAATVCFRVTVAGYVLLAAAGIHRAGSLSPIWQAVRSGDYENGYLKNLFAPVAGITSLTQVGIAYIVLAAVLLASGRRGLLVRRTVIILVLGVVRGYFLSERLAILELVVPLVAVAAISFRQRRRLTAAVRAVPLVAVPLLVVVFGAFEYSRSWVYYRTRTTLSYPEFVVNRLVGYYATAYNNGALQLQYARAHNLLPYASIQGFWTAPGVAQTQLYERLTSANGTDPLAITLLQHGNPEFNNPGGLAVPLFDFGVWGGFVFFFLAGVIIGLTYSELRRGSVFGVLLYPLLFTGLLEIPRYVYWTEGRVVPAYIALITVAVLARRAARRGSPRRLDPPSAGGGVGEAA
jgi:predicted membrane protein